MRLLFISVLSIIVVLSFVGLGIFGTSLWIAYAAMAVIEVVMAVALIVSRWINIPAAIVVAILAVFQSGQSYFYEQVRYSANDPVIPVDNFGVLVLGLLAIYLIATRPLRRS